MKKSKICLSLLSVFVSIIIPCLVFLPSVAGSPERNAGVINISFNTPADEKRVKNGSDYFAENSITSDDKENFREYVYVSGEPIGIKLYCDGVIVVGTEKIKTANGYTDPAHNAGIKRGDVIKSVDGNRVYTNSQVSKLIGESDGREMNFVLQRDGREINTVFRSVFCDEENSYKAGLWIRDSSAGIGTLTFFTNTNSFASLGHAVCDIDTQTVFPICDGDITSATITGIYKGSQGTAGELSGTLEKESEGKIIINDNTGIYGTLSSDFIPNNRIQLPVALKSEVTDGYAQIIATVENGCTEYFDVEISKIDYKDPDGKNFVITVTDEALLMKTGGIVQGMSGSPVIQNGKLIGAVTHVFLNDPTGGYGIFADIMLNKVKNLY